MALFLLPELGTYAGTLLIWECEVLNGFAEPFRDHLPVLTYLADSFLWTNGVVSEGNRSLLYGGVTYPLLVHAGFSTWTLRAVSAAWGLLSAPLAYLLARRWLERPAAFLTAGAWAVSTTVLHYARYGTSLSATLATLLLASLAVEAARARGSRAWWPAPLAVCALAVASLHYSPGRLVVLLLLGALAGHALLGARRLNHSGAAGVALALVLLVAFVAVQVRHGRTRLFLHAHGEQVLGMLNQPGDVASYLGRPARRGVARSLDAVALGAALVRSNLPGLGRLAGIVPYSGPAAEPGRLTLLEDPPKIPLYFVPLLPFLALGAALSLRRWRAWPHWLLLAWVGVTVAASLLSNRIDYHRLVTLCVPVCVWLGAGLWVGLAALRRAGLPRVARTALVAVVLGAALLDNVWLLNLPRPVARAPLMVAAVGALEGIDGEVATALVGDEEDRAMVELVLLERERTLGIRGGDRLARRLQDLLQDPGKRARNGAALTRDLAVLASHGTLLLGPADDTMGLALSLETQGYRVRRVTGPVDLFVVAAPRDRIRTP
jgi:4-amino-4-deoxy-L-arabinose transferase-like glycosyltransferase